MRRHGSPDKIMLGTREYCQPDGEAQSRTDPPGSPVLSPLAPFPSSPKSAPKHVRDQSRSFFSNRKASKSSNRVNTIEATIRPVPADATRNTREQGMYSLRENTGSTPDLSKATFDNGSVDASDGKLGVWICFGDSMFNVLIVGSRSQTDTSSIRPTGTSIMSDTALITSRSEFDGAKKGKPRLAQLLTRTRSMRMDENGRRSKPPTPIRTTGSETISQQPHDYHDSGGLKTAPLNREKDRSIRDLMGSAMRNRSADRQPPSKQSQPITIIGRVDQEPTRGPNGSNPGSQAGSSTSHREGAGTHLFHNIKSSSTRAADGIGKVGKGFFGKMARSGNGNPRDHADDEPYVCTTINLPLVEQTRRTRIAKRLENSKDKTEFWMPALPWRCIE